MYAGRGDIKIEHTLLNSCVPEQSPQTVFWDGYDYHLGLNYRRPVELSTEIDRTNIQVPLEHKMIIFTFIRILLEENPGTILCIKEIDWKLIHSGV